jgi:hypothetical protein
MQLTVPSASKPENQRQTGRFLRECFNRPISRDRISDNVQFFLEIQYVKGCRSARLEEDVENSLLRGLTREHFELLLS